MIPWRSLLSVVLLTGVSFGANRMTIQGRDVLLDGKPHFPHGMIHLSESDLANLKKIGINSLSIDLGFNTFDSQRSEAENRQALEGVLKLADAAHKSGQTILWLFSFHYTPDWFWQRYPDARMKKYDGSDGSGGWSPMCLNHPGFRREAETWVSFVVKFLGKHPATIGYILWNEPHLFGDVDYHPYTIAAFHRWLAGTYKTVESLNTVWGTSYKRFEDVKAPPPRANSYWVQFYDQMATQKGTVQKKSATAEGNAALWMDWMRFRQENYTDFWVWQTGVIKKVDPTAIVTSKIVPMELYGSHAYGAGTNTEQWVNRYLDVLGFDLYAHLDDDFLARWKSDFFLSMSAGKPLWHTEMNFSFLKERGLATPAQWRSCFYYQLARGVGGIWNYHWTSGDEFGLLYPNGKFPPVTHELAKVSREAAILAPVMAKTKPAGAQVAVLHSTTTGLALPGDYAPTVDQSTLVELLYRSQTPFEFVTENMVRKGELKKYRVLLAAGAAALPSDVIEAIRKFTVDNGGHVLANARFGELDEYARPRSGRSIPWLGVNVNGFHRESRKKTGTLAFSREGRTVEDKPITGQIKMDTWSAKPIKLAGGTVTSSGSIYGNPDVQYDWSCGGRHELYWEDVRTVGEGKVVGAFENGKVAIIETPQTLYVARDIGWVDTAFETFFRNFLKKSGVKNRNEVVLKHNGQPVPSVDVRMLEGQGKRILFVINSVRTLSYDGKPIEVQVVFDAQGEITDALTGKKIPSRWENFRRVIPMTLNAGDVRVLVGKSYPSGWQDVRERDREVKTCVKPSPKPYIAWRKSRNELWVYDSRPELGVGMHGVSEGNFDLAKKLGIRLVRYTVYWNNVERTDKPGVYDENTLKQYDTAVAMAKKKGVELLLIVHGNPPGVNWDRRQAGYERFARFMSFLVKRYPSVKYWELWNEMDTSFTDLFGANHPEYPAFEKGRCYAQMLKLAYPAIKQANPKAWVLVGGLSFGAPTDFIRGIYEEGARDDFDFMNIHTYGVPATWGMVVSGYQAKSAMGEYGDFDRPLWNTEFGVNAGGLYQAWQVNTGKGFDDGHLRQWKGCIEDAMKHRLYWKIMPYQFVAGNESMNEVLKDPKTGIKLPAGHTIDDYGFGLLRADGKTPRPTYEWLLKAQVNAPIQKNAELVVDVETNWDGSWQPQGVNFQTAGHTMILKDIKVTSLDPTVIAIVPTADRR